MVRLIKRGADEVVHGGVNNDELPVAVAFAIKYASEQHAGFGYDRTAWLNQDFEAVSGGAPAHSLNELANGRRLVAWFVSYAKTAAEIERTDGQATGAQPFH